MWKPVESVKIVPMSYFHHFDGDYAELLIYNRALSDAEIQKIEGYLAHKWGLTGNLDASHPLNPGLF